jgi:hypothetical protein
MRKARRKELLKEIQLPFPPMQFGAKNIKELFAIFLAHQLDPVLGQFALHTIAAFNGNAHLPIHGQKTFFLADRYRDSNSRMFFYHKRSMSKSVR